MLVLEGVDQQEFLAAFLPVLLVGDLQECRVGALPA